MLRTRGAEALAQGRILNTFPCLTQTNIIVVFVHLSPSAVFRLTQRHRVSSPADLILSPCTFTGYQGRTQPRQVETLP